MIAHIDPPSKIRDFIGRMGRVYNQGDRVFMARNQFILDYTGERAPGIVFNDIKDVRNKKE